VLRARPQPPVHPARHPVQPGRGVDEQHRWAAVGLTGGQPDLGGFEQFATTEHAGVPSGALRKVLHQMRVIAAPRHVGAPDLTAPEAETIGAGAHQQGGVMLGASATTGPQMGTVLHGKALRGPLGHRHQQLHGHHGELAHPGVAHRGLRREHPERVQLQGQLHPHPCGVVVGGHAHPVALHPDRLGQLQPQRGRTGLPAHLHTGGAEPAVGLRRQHGQRRRVVQRAVRDHRAGGQLQSGRLRAQVGPPVQHPGQQRTGGVQHHTHPGGPQGADIRSSGGAHPFVAPRVRPDTNCFCRAKNTIRVGRATSTEPADSRL